MSRLLLSCFAFLLALVAVPARAACTGSSPTWTSTPDQTSVSTCLTNATAGDTINVSAGSAAWSGLSINKAVTLNGAGVGSTTITLSGNNDITKQSAGVIRIKNFSFSKTNGGNESKGITIGGSWLNAEPVIIQNNAFTISGSGLIKIAVAGGVIIANNTFSGAWDDSFIQPKDDGDSENSWHKNSTMGSADTTGKRNIYVETNTFTGGTNQGIDCDDATRCVFRYNTCNYMSFNSHGLDTSPKGIRHFEVYNNTFKNDSAGGWTGSTAQTDTSNQNWAVWIRGGTGVIYNNVIDDIANSYWGYGKEEAKFDIRTQQDNSGVGYGLFSDGRAWYSAGQGTYPRQHQLAVSWDEDLTNSVGINGGVGNYFIDPIYVWGNTGAGASGGGFLSWANGGSWGSQTGYFNSGRDYVFGNTAKPGYTAYTYPHPLVSGSLLAAPTNLQWEPR